MTKSWKTTAGGIGALLGALALLANMLAGNAEFTMENIGIIIAAVSSAVGLLFAKDAAVTGVDGIGVGAQTAPDKK